MGFLLIDLDLEIFSNCKLRNVQYEKNYHITYIVCFSSFSQSFIITVFQKINLFFSNIEFLCVDLKLDF